MKTIPIIFILLAIILFGCSGDITPTSNPETFTGEVDVYIKRELYQWPFERTDEVQFIVDRANYRILFTTRKSKLCYTHGIVSDFGTSSMFLTPLSYATNSGACDTSHVPRGEFKTVFRGDSLYIGPDTLEITTTNDSGIVSHDLAVWSFKLSK